ncbi:MAG: hypothetical protein GY847_14750 [Proteobacteria bacterium]|nr:hypothetical protein [Pseudomonadota bacterium]
MSRLIRMLLSKKLITRDQFEQATFLQTREGGTVGYHLIRLDAISDHELIDFLSQHFMADHWPRSKIRDIDSEIVSLVPSELAADLRILPLVLDGISLTMGVTDPSRVHVIEEAAFHTGYEISPVVISEIDMTWALEHYYGIKPSSQRVQQIEKVEDEGFDDEHTLQVSSDGWNLDQPIDPDADTDTEEENLFKKQVLTAEDIVEDIAYEKPDTVENSITSEQEPEPQDLSSTIAVRAPIKIGPMLSPEPADRQGLTSIPGRPAGESGKHRLSEGELIAAIHSASNRLEITSLAIEYLMHFAKRAAFFVVRKTEIQGYEIAGDLTSQSAIRSFRVPFSSESTLRDVAVEHRIHLGPLRRHPADAILSAALGGRPKRVLVIPVEIAGRVVGLLYADRLDVTMPPWNRLERLAEAVGENLKRLILNRET